MIKRTIYVGSPAYLSTRNEQLVINLPDAHGMDNKSGLNTIPIEDIGVLVLDNSQITITQAVLEKLLRNNAAVITCNSTHHPTGLLLNLDGNTLQHERWQEQIAASAPLKKQLWQQTIEYKIANQAELLRRQGIDIENMLHWKGEVLSGDAHNHEARAAAYYWSQLFGIEGFLRGRDELPPNNMLNYGYAILRAITARSLVESGLLPTLGIHHHNRYNAYCLADDIMEPYRPFVDALVLSIVQSGKDYSSIDKEIKTTLLQIPTLDVRIQQQNSPLMVAMRTTTASVVKCFSKELRKIVYPSFV